MILSDIPVNLEQDPPNSVFFNQTSAEQLSQSIEEAGVHRSSGPDLTVEQQAREVRPRAVMRYGSRFLEIAKRRVEKLDMLSGDNL